jgi:transcriptional regulator with GAF, ATPase, and Fis domain
MAGRLRYRVGQGFRISLSRRTGQEASVRDPAIRRRGRSGSSRRFRAHPAAATRAARDLHPSLASERPDPILLLGERGSGKDLVARYLHAWSARRERPFIVANCAEISDELAASRFLGHQRGAFTGAVSDQPGFFRAAQRGVLFLDEIADLSPRAQGTLLRVLENHAVTPVGETKEVPVDVAVILATNVDLDQAVRDDRLRADFHDRFRVQALRIEPLRERPWDTRHCSSTSDMSTSTARASARWGSRRTP